METVRNIEKVMEGWFKSVPHLPKEWSKWLAENAWWLNSIGVVLSAVGLLGIIGALMGVNSFMGYVDSVYKTYSITSPVNNSWWVAAQVVSLVFLAVDLFIMANAIQPLRAMKKKGWELTFIAMLVGVTSSVVSAIVSMGSINLVGSVVGAAISLGVGGYVLFELKPYFKK